MNVRKNQKRNRFESLIENIFEGVSNKHIDKVSKTILEERNGKEHSFELKEGERVKMIRSKQQGHLSAVGPNYVAVILDSGLTRVVGRYEVSKL